MRNLIELLPLLTCEDVKLYLITFGLNEMEYKLMELQTYAVVTHECGRT